MNIYFLILHSDLPMFGKLNRCGRIIGKSDQYKTLYIIGFGWFLLGNTQRANARCHKSVSPSLCFLILESGKNLRPSEKLCYFILLKKLMRLNFILLDYQFRLCLLFYHVNDKTPFVKQSCYLFSLFLTLLAFYKIFVDDFRSVKEKFQHTFNFTK